MKVILTKNGYGSKFFDDDGKEVDMHASGVTVQCSAGRATHVEIELPVVETTEVHCENPTYVVGRHYNVVALVLANGETVKLKKEGF